MARDTEIAQIFDYMATGQWLYDLNQESISGPGSTVSYTEGFRPQLENFLRQCGCKSLLDAPCGDFNWMRLVQLPQGARYFGGDIVAQIIDRNRASFGNSDRLFFEINLTNEPLPDADVWLCRDCLFHLSYDHIFQVLRNSLRSRIDYYLLTSHLNAENSDAVTGSFRELNLLSPPFNLPTPRIRMNDSVSGFPARYVGVWDRAAIHTALTDIG
jgi:hypothetical protein